MLLVIEMNTTIISDVDDRDSDSSDGEDDDDDDQKQNENIFLLLSQDVMTFFSPKITRS